MCRLAVAYGVLPSIHAYIVRSRRAYDTDLHVRTMLAGACADCAQIVSVRGRCREKMERSRRRLSDIHDRESHTHVHIRARLFHAPRVRTCSLPSVAITTRNSHSKTPSTTPSHKKSRHEKRASQTSSTLTTFVENTCNIYTFKQVYYESIFKDLPNNTNYVP
jgi:hypothetical protein